MPDSFNPRLFRTIWYTPLQDALRWRWSAQLDWRRPIALAELPVEIKSLICNIVQPAWLLRDEKADIATELVAHFTDGLATGQSPQDLIQQFGDARRAARLIVCAKRRGRPLLLKVIFHAPAAVSWSVIFAAVFYLLLTGFFWFGRPTIRVDYVALVNASIQRTPPGQTAWPIYRQAMLELGEVPSELDPDQSHWTRWFNQLKNKQHIIELARLAASKAALGFTFGVSGSEYDPQLWPAHSERWRQSITVQPLIWSASLPQMSRFIQLARILQSDLIDAQSTADEHRFMLDVRAFFSMAIQFHDEKLADSFWSSAMQSSVMDSVERALTDHPTMLSDADLRYISDRLSSPMVAADIVHLDSEHFFVLDSLQRMYTDNGHGDGRITPAGFKYLARLNVWTKPTPTNPLIWPVSFLVSPSRKEVLDTYQSMLQLAHRNFQLPARRADWRQYNQKLHELWRARPEDAGRQFLACALPDLQKTQMFAERHLGSRDGRVVGIALEMFRRAHSHYPARLIELVPQFLPVVPADRITGDPIKYKLIAGQPLVYSVGEDRIDDGGVPGTEHGTPILHPSIPYKSRPDEPDTISGNFISPYAVAEWDVIPQNTKPGDWILFPQWKYRNASN